MSRTSNRSELPFNADQDLFPGHRPQAVSSGSKSALKVAPVGTKPAARPEPAPLPPPRLIEERPGREYESAPTVAFPRSLIHWEGPQDAKVDAGRSRTAQLGSEGAGSAANAGPARGAGSTPEQRTRGAVQLGGLTPAHNAVQLNVAQSSRSVAPQRAAGQFAAEAARGKVQGYRSASQFAGANARGLAMPGAVLPYRTASSTVAPRRPPFQTIALPPIAELVPSRLQPIVGLLLIFSGLMLLGWFAAREWPTDLRPAVRVLLDEGFKNEATWNAPTDDTYRGTDADWRASEAPRQGEVAP